MADVQFKSTGEVADALGYKNDKVRRMCETGRFPGARRDGHAGHWRIPDNDVQQYLEDTKPKVRRRA